MRFREDQEHLTIAMRTEEVNYRVAASDFSSLIKLTAAILTTTDATSGSDNN